MSMNDRILSCAQGKLQGIPGRNPELTTFRGIPYAQPPVGSLRWQAPKPPIPWQGIRDCSRFSAVPVQAKGQFDVSVFEDVFMSEDCLYLNITTPAKTGNEKLPVLFWIYGGAFQGGCGSDENYDGEAYAEQGIVVVTINYRVGLMGFLCHPDMRAESPHGTSGNFGLLDQIAALKWVNENIAAFGGDPERVTIDGQSAGSMSVTNLMCSPLSRELIAGAICQSADPFMRILDEEIETAEQYGVKLAAHYGASDLDEFRKVPFVELVGPDFDAMKENFRKVCVPVVDGVVLPKKQVQCVLSGETAKVPMIIGSTRDEGFGDLATLYGWLGDDASRIKPFLEGCGEAAERDRLANDLTFARHSFWAKLRQEKFGLNTWNYVFSYGVRQPDGSRISGHSDEIPYTFRTLDLYLGKYRKITPNADEYALAKQVNRYWTNFIKTGNPNGEGLPVWDKKDGYTHLNLVAPAPAMENDFYKPELRTVFDAVEKKFSGR